MAWQSGSLVIGYHGCDKSVGHQIVTGTSPFNHSVTKHDWLGKGIYFWEADPVRALEWAQWKSKIGQCPEPFVIGAIIDLGNCFDLLVRENLDVLTATHAAYVASQEAAGLPIPVNKDSPKGASQNKVMRFLDCAVINYLHDSVETEPFDSVRGLFVEGKPTYPGAEIFSLTHAQIAVLNESCIKGVFLPR